MTRQHMSVLMLILIVSAHTSFTISPALATTAPTATITVTSKLDTADPGKCRLRDAITAANTNTATGDCPAGTAGLDTIGFSLGNQCNLIPCKIPLTGTLPTVIEDLTINGNNVTISGEHSFRVLYLGVVIVNISNLTIANGNVPDRGGAINMSDAPGTPGTALTLTHVFFSGNHADIGGAIYEPRGALTVVNSNFSGNTAGAGGAIDGSRLTVVDSVFSNNTAVDAGGALLLAGAGGATISGSAFSGNSAASGGAIADALLVNLQVIDSVFDNNAATSTSSGGGAIYVDRESNRQVTLTNVTISGNSAKNHGGGIRDNTSAPFSLNNVTITNNLADSDNDGNGDGGGIFTDIGTVQIQNSIIAGNFDTPDNAGGGLKMPDCRGTFSSRGYNLIGRNDNNVCGGLINGVSADQVGSAANPIDPLLAALANNGGSTQTHALLPGSPAMNTGNPLAPGGGLACAVSDQRGIARPQGSACDIGAFEFEYQSLYLPLILR